MVCPFLSISEIATRQATRWCCYNCYVVVGHDATSQHAVGWESNGFIDIDWLYGKKHVLSFPIDRFAIVRDRREITCLVRLMSHETLVFFAAIHRSRRGYRGRRKSPKLKGCNPLRPTSFLHHSELTMTHYAVC